MMGRGVLGGRGRRERRGREKRGNLYWGLAIDSFFVFFEVGGASILGVPYLVKLNL